jgi:hypothetical protein
MKRNFPASQQGLGLSAFLFGAVLLVLFSILGLKMVPAYIESAEVANIFSAVAADPELQNAGVAELKGEYVKRASIDDIRAIRADDIEFQQQDGRWVLSTHYSVTIPLLANVSLLLDFNPSSAGH